MLKKVMIATVVAALVSALALPAAAAPAGTFRYVGGEGGWELVQAQYGQAADKALGAGATAAPGLSTSASPASGGFEYVGAEQLWQVAQHHYVFDKGRWTMGDDCDHAMHQAAATPSAREIEQANLFSPGA